MKNVTPNKVLPEWAIIELGQVAEQHGVRITVKQTRNDWPQLKIAVNSDKRVFHFLISMRDDWDDLCILGEGDLWDIVEERYVECINE